MKAADKKEYIIVLVIVIGAIIIGLISSSLHPKIETIYPDKQIVLADNEFVVTASAGSLAVGKSSWDEVIKVFPTGKTLGMSTVYHPDDLDCVLTFTNKENILTKMDISTSSLLVARGIKVNDSFSAVENAYGPNYIRIYDRKTPTIFDAIYGQENIIVFKIKNNTVQKIILQYELPLKNTNQS